MLTELVPNRHGVIRRTMNHFPHLINMEQNEALMREISFYEVEEVVMVMPSNNTLGLDVFTTNLFKSCWPFIGQEVHALVEESWRYQKVCTSLNKIFLTLIPNPSKYDDPSGYQSISLFSVL